MSETSSYNVIKILFDSVRASELKNEKFGVIIHFEGIIFTHESRPTNFIAWFKYNHDNNYIIVNYFSFPVQEKFEIPYNSYDAAKQFDVFLEEITQNKKIIDIKPAKQLKIPLPAGLQNDLLFNAMNKYKYQDRIKNGMIYVTVDEGESYYFGFKSDKIEFVRQSFSYTKFDQIKEEIFAPITNAILEHETPEEWKKEHSKWQKTRIPKTFYGLM